MATVIKTIKGRQYRYLQRSYRVGGKVKTESKYLGPVGSAGSGGGESVDERDRRVRKEMKRELGFALADLERERIKTEAYQREHFGGTPREREAKAQQEHLDKLHEDFGLKVSQEEAPTEGGEEPTQS